MFVPIRKLRGQQTHQHPKVKRLAARAKDTQRRHRFTQCVVEKAKVSQKN